MAWKLAFKGKMDKVPLKKLQKPALTAKSRTERKVENQTRSPSENAIISEAWALTKFALLSVHKKIWTFGNFLSAKCYDERMAWMLQIWKYNNFWMDFEKSKIIIVLFGFYWRFASKLSNFISKIIFTIAF